MTKWRRSFSVEQKLHIIQEADQLGVTQTLQKHNLSHSVFQRWKNQFNTGGVPSLKPRYHKVDPKSEPCRKKMQDSKRSLVTRLWNWNLKQSF